MLLEGVHSIVFRWAGCRWHVMVCLRIWGCYCKFQAVQNTFIPSNNWQGTLSVWPVSNAIEERVFCQSCIVQFAVSSTRNHHTKKSNIFWRFTSLKVNFVPYQMPELDWSICCTTHHTVFVEIDHLAPNVASCSQVRTCCMTVPKNFASCAMAETLSPCLSKVPGTEEHRHNDGQGKKDG